MKATIIFIAYSFSILFFFTWITGNQISASAHARWQENLKALEIGGVRTDRTKPSKRVARKPSRSKRWLEGVWEGTAYQSNTKENWTLKLTAKNNIYRIDYPSLSCGGEWKLIRRGRRTANFREKLTYGQSDCVDNITVTIQKLNQTQIAYWYVEPNQTRVIGIAVLDRQQ